MSRHHRGSPRGRAPWGGRDSADWLEEDAQGRALRHPPRAGCENPGTRGPAKPPSSIGGHVCRRRSIGGPAHGKQLNELEREFVDRESSGERAMRRSVSAERTAACAACSSEWRRSWWSHSWRVRSPSISAARARQAATTALSQSLGAKAVAEPQLDTALLLAEEAVKLDDSPQSESNLLTVLLRSPSAIRVIHTGAPSASPQAVAVSPDLKTLAVVNGDGELWWFFDASTGETIGGPVRGVAATRVSHARLYLRWL